MKVSIVNGSPRKNGATARMLKEIEKQFNTYEGVTTVFHNLSDIEMRFCNGCENCYSTGRCVIKSDGLNATVESVKQSDAIVIGTPTHGSNVSALLKNFMDRGHFIVEQSLYGKHCMAVTTYEIADGVAALRVLKKFFMVSGGSVASSELVKVGFNKNPLSSRLEKSIRKKVNKLYMATKRNKSKSFFEYIFNDVIVVGIIWKSFFRKHPEQFRGVIDKYKEAGIHRCVTRTISLKQ